MNSQKVLADQSAGQADECFVNVIATFVSDPQATELVHPTQCAFYNPTMLAQSTPMRRVPLRKNGLNPEMAQGLAMRLGIIAPVPLHSLGTTTRMTNFAPHRGNRLHQGQELSHIMCIGTR
jgi:hypothetical protein